MRGKQNIKISMSVLEIVNFTASVDTNDASLRALNAISVSYGVQLQQYVPLIH